MLGPSSSVSLLSRPSNVTWRNFNVVLLFVALFFLFRYRALESHIVYHGVTYLICHSFRSLLLSIAFILEPLLVLTNK
jgi:hypothetical protein